MISMNKVCKQFGKGDATVYALRGVTLDINEGEMVAIIGKSGSGKSTLLNVIGGMASMNTGSYVYKGKRVETMSQNELTGFRRDEIGYVVQYFALIDDMTVFQNVAVPLKYKGYSKKKIKDMVMNSLEELGIADKAKSYPTELSGGQQQRVAIARAIVKEPSLILADEPTGALDEATGIEVQNIFRELNNKGKTVIIVTHDNKVAQKCDRTIRLKDGVVCDEEDYAI